MSTVKPRRPKSRNRLDRHHRLDEDTTHQEPDLLRDAIKMREDSDHDYAKGVALHWLSVKPFQLAMVPFAMLGWFFTNIHTLMVLSVQLLIIGFFALIAYLEFFA